MLLHYLIAVAAFFGIFVLFLVLSRTLNTTINHLIKLHYLLQKELDIKNEQMEIAQLLEFDKSADSSQESGQDEAPETQPESSKK